MAVINLDFENVSGTGLKGVMYLTEKDSLNLFYSTSCTKMSQEYLNQIRETGCRFNIYKLVWPRANALDFYIGVEAGRLAALGEKQICLISRDKGFLSIEDYFSLNEALKETKLVVAEDIEHALVKLNDPEDMERRKIIQRKMQMMDIEVEYGKIQENNRIRKAISAALQDSEYSIMTDNIVRFCTDYKDQSSKKLYTGTLHQFGLKDGAQIYRLIKDVI